MMINQITLHDLLPLVFRGMEDSDRIRSSEIWEERNFIFTRGCRICLQAESGSGKSSLLSFVYGNRKDYKGTIAFDGKDIRGLGVEQWCDIRTRHLALLPQEMRLFPEMTVSQNISLKNNLTRHKTDSQIREMLERLGVADKHDTPAGRLSIGQQQRVAIVRTLCQPFDFIFLDEPVSHLDSHNNSIAAQLVQQEAAAQGAGIIATSVGNHLLLDNPRFVAL